MISMELLNIHTGEQSKAGVVALGAALGLVGLGLVAKRKKEDEA